LFATVSIRFLIDM